jgi:probable rRNA maturation factor
MTARPTLEVDVAAVGVRVPLARARVAELATGVLRAEGVRSAQLSIAFVDERAIAALNWRHLRHRGPTDVISFALPAAAPHAPVGGDVYIAPDVAREHARANGVGVRAEIARLVVHGTLHVLGWEHPEDEERTRSPMWRRQERLLARLFAARATGGAT